MRALFCLIVLSVLAGCTFLTARELDQRLGAVNPARYDEAPPPRAPAPDYWSAVRPILDRRCVSCHACYDAPCQLKLTRYDGITRGASPDKVYAGARLLAATPNRLGVDADSNAEWRARGFHPVLNERSATPAANREGSVLYQLLALKRQEPGPGSGPLSEEDFSFDLDRPQSCTPIEGFDSFAREHPAWGMPYGLPALSAAEHATLAAWIEAGAPYRPLPPPSAAVAAQLREWEAVLNGDSFKAQLAARYIYEHWFIGHLYFPEQPDYRFELVRSRTPPGQPISLIATRRPYDAPGVARVYYRLRAQEETPVAKTYMPLALDAARLARLRRWFFDAPIAVDTLPGYAPTIASNPFRTFRALPAEARYRFMLDDAQFTLTGFMKGPVCRGQVALNVINDHFWVLFYAPESAPEQATQALLDATQPQLRLPAEDDGSVGILAWYKYARAEKRYLRIKTDFMARLGKTPPKLDDLWNGDGRNPTAGLTVFRHFDSASVIRGLAGERPQTTLLLGYPLFERMHYLLVAGFDVYGNTSHQLATRLYMDFLRMEGEQNFLTLLPLKERQKVLDSWYRGRPGRIREFADAAAYFPGDSGVRYRSGEPLAELYGKIAERLRPVRERRLDFGGANGWRPADVAELKKLATLGGTAASRMPEHSLLALRDGRGRLHVASLLRNSAHTNVAELFREEARRLPAEDRLIALDGFVGAYPNTIFRLREEQLPEFVQAVAALASEADQQRLVERFAVRRSDPGFWALSDALHQHWRELAPREAAILDYSRLENR